jgi:hypothetical protein
MQELVERLQTRLRNYKRQIEEAEEIAALNLAKFRKTQVGFFAYFAFKQHALRASLVADPSPSPQDNFCLFHERKKVIT